jgi:ATP-dependent exoDNAse (exonuclease V) beta subunit
MPFVVYKSSAGSGKTYTLVKEYLKIALNSPSPYTFKYILAITFTNKAAAEMKERVISSLAKLSKEKDEPGYDAGYLADIAEATGLTETDLRTRAKATFEAILHHYSDFAISTIDSFVHRVVRAFAFDLGIPLSFNVELDADKLLGHAIDELISRAGSDALLTKALVEFTESRTDDEKSWRIENDLKTFAYTLLDTEGRINARKLRSLTIADILETRQKLETFIHQFKAEMVAIGKQALQIIENYDIPTDAFAYGKTGVGKYFIYLSQGRVDKFMPSKRNVVDVVENNKWAPAKSNYTAAINDAANELDPLFRQAVKLLEKDHERFNYYSLLNKSIFLLALLNELQKIIDEYRVETGTVHISEFDERLGSVVQNEPVPYVYERLGEKFKYFLIDEFQDTSTTQWQNLLPLIHNSLSGDDKGINYFNMVVGDAKQAIYRWRGGDVEQFVNLPAIANKDNNELVAERAEMLASPGVFVEEFLSKNWRSKREVIEFNNAFFEFASRRLENYQHIYNKQAQEFDDKKTGGLVRFEFLPETVAVDADDLTNDDMYCQKVVELIRSLQAEGYKLGDIAILTRKNTYGSLLAQYLTEQGINIVSDESLLLIKSPAVNLLISFLKRFANPEDNIASAAILETILGQAGDSVKLNEVLKTIERKETTYTEQLMLFAPALLNPRLKGLSLYELVEEAARLLGLTIKADAYLQQFVDVVLKFMADQGNSVPAFLTWWAEDSWRISVSLPESNESVRIMTIHKSKGLQFPVVIFSHANWRESNRGDFEWIENTEPDLMEQLPMALVPLEKSMETTRLAPMYEEELQKRKLDTLNLLYVAMTRPEERLYVFSTLPGRNGTIADFYKSFFIKQGLWVEGQMVYATDSPVGPPVVKPAKHSPTTKLNRVLSNNWDEKILISTDAKKVWDVEEKPQTAYGRIVHQILAWITVPADAPKALQRAIEQGLISTDELPEVESRVNSVITNAEYAVLFDENAKVWAEQEILLPNGNTYRPDRVVLYTNKLIIADYKTGLPANAHQRQVAEYADILAQMGYTNIETKLIYL